MSEHAAEHGHADPSHYIRIWAILVLLLVASVIGPMFGLQILTLITAFGIAVVKAYLVATRFMHINMSPKFVTYMMATCLVFMALFFTASAPDVMKDSGSNWVKNQAKWQYAPVAKQHGEGHH